MSAGMSYTRRLGEGMPPSWSTASIYDARAFRVGKGRKVHHPVIFTPVRVVGACGVVGYTAECETTMPAEWADSFVTCPTCLARAS